MPARVVKVRHMERARPIMEILAANLRAALAGKVKSHIAKTAGVSGRALQKYEAQQAAAQIDKLDAIARALRVPTWQLLVPNFDPGVNSAELARLVQNYLAATPKGRSFMAEVCASSINLQQAGANLSAGKDD